MSKGYSEEFKKDAVNLSISSDKPRKHITRGFGIPELTLRQWERKYRSNNLNDNDLDEISRLKQRWIVIS